MVVVECEEKPNNNLQQKNKKKKSKKKMKMAMRKKTNEYGLVTYEELPEYMKENEYIRGYYRAEWPLLHACHSLFSWHNETINIWTHLVGFFVFLGFTLLHMGLVPRLADFFGNLPWSISSSSVKNVSCNQATFFSVASALIKVDQQPNSSSGAAAAGARAARWPFFVFLAGSMFCLLTSSLCHLLCCHSRRLNVLLSRLDYAGIAVMIVCSFFPPIYYIFQCTPLFQLLYLLGISALGVLTVLALLSPELSQGRFRSYRALLFLCMGLSGVVPAVHATVANWSEPRRNVTLACEGAMAASYITGTLFYVTRVPERWKPGTFDLTGHSHQIFHVFVIGGALAHYAAGLVFLDYRDVVGCT
ncbi:heptahelical transmembrane protein ADIPOR1-like [Iris pallida]|uniref:Heptahelical transmembrane protein ADIPOR1-like n=1 Tax=Iris pallida TaxID=29817 RepID=A0AAX6FRG3_IRIPA|nr:heptahelical transmembrane protein ADIPOR1-like [Iris pallida]